MIDVQDYALWLECVAVIPAKAGIQFSNIPCDFAQGDRMISALKCLSKKPLKYNLT